jgi:alpha-glucosidase
MILARGAWQVMATRLGDSAARSAALMSLTLPGMSFIYNGEEIGMLNGHVPESMVQDPAAVSGAGRDPQRTPLHWSDAKNAGFTKAKNPWLPVSKDYKERNIKTEDKDPNSSLSLYKSLAKLRNQSEAIRYGDFKLIKTGKSSVLGYKRVKGKKEHTVLVNFSEEVAQIKLPKSVKLGKFEVSSDATTLHKDTKGNKVHLLPNEAAVFSA